jgi:photosystem II stability/assembly factor-like uncharacterized protein
MMKTTILMILLMIANRSVEAQSTWIVCNSPTTGKLLSVCMPGQDKVLAGSANGILLMSTDYGQTFSTIPLGIVEDIHDICFFNSQNGRMLLGNNFMKTADGGSTWNLISEIPGNPKAMHFLNPDTGFVACDLGLAFSTFNGGILWNSLGTGVTDRLETVNFKNIDDGFWGGRNVTSLRTINQGLTFTTGVIPANGDIKDIQFVNSDTGYSCGDNGEVLFTDNGGNTWSAQQTPSTEPGMNALHFTDPMHGWCSGEAGTVFHTSDGGNTWLVDLTSTQSEMNDIHLFDNGHGFAVGDNGTVLRLGNGLTALNETETGINSFAIYPNPAHLSATITFSLSINADITITLSDMLGANIKTIPRGVMEPGIHTLSMDCSELTDGIYFYSLTVSGRNKKTGKLVVSK